MNKLLLILVLFMVLVGCNPPPYPHKFETGDVIVLKINNKKGIVTYIYECADLVDVRVEVVKEHMPDLFGGEKYISNYDTVRFHEYELERYGEDK